MSMSDLIAVDFDNTLTTGEGPPFWDDEWNVEEADEEIVEWVNNHYRNGDYIIVWTARPWSEAHKVAAFLERHEVEYNGIRCNKGGASLYVDDKSVHPQQLKE